jgi:hypothetical protein
LQDARRGQLLEVLTDTPRPPIDALSRVAGVAEVQSFGDRAHVRLQGVTQAAGADAITAALKTQGIAVTSVRPIAASLEDVFIDLIRPQSEARL